MCVVVGDLDSGCVQDSVYFFVLRERPLIVLQPGGIPFARAPVFSCHHLVTYQDCVTVYGEG